MSGREFRATVGSGPVHFMGMGGAGMCALAELVSRSGTRVSGCDQKDGPALRTLSRLGIETHVGHDPAHVVGARAVVVTSAVPTDHPELQRARDLGVPVFRRAEALGSWVARGRVVAVAGTHGKTTTTAMATEILAGAGTNPTGLVGGHVKGWEGNLRFGSEDLFVVEADEYDRSFLTLTPDVAVVTNVEADHLDIYGDLAGVQDGFRSFLAGVRSGARIVLCADDSGAASLISVAGDAAYTYGTSAGAQLRAVEPRITEGLTRGRVVEEGREVGELVLRVGGMHNLRNALAAAAAARTLGVAWAPILMALATFEGVGRRFDTIGTARGVTVIDDYAHHPTEVAATLAAARALLPGRRLVAVFQPHLFSRTRDLHAELGAALAAADRVWVTEVFPARETPIPGVSGSLVAAAARDAGAREVRFHAGLETLAGAVADELVPGDVLLTLGAGSIEGLGPQLLALLEEDRHA